MLIPYGFSGQIPFLSLGSDVGRRVKVHQGSSKVSGDFVIEDVDVEGHTHRRLVYLDNQLLVQSEARLKTVKRKNKTKLVVDFGYISTYHTFMCVGVQLSRSHSGGRVAVLGLGGGGLCMFLKKCYEDISITAVDLDPAMLEIAKNHFELQLDEHLQVQIKDGVDFLNDEADAGHQYSTVMFDMDSKDRSVGLSCPPRQFLDSEQLENVKKILTNDGIIYDVIVEPPSVGSTTDEHGHVRPVAFMPNRVNGQYIMEGLASSFLFSLGGLGFIILDRTHNPSTPKLNRILLISVAFLCILVSFFTTWIFMRMKLPGYLQN